MLDQVTGMRVFVRVAAAGSLAAAGREIGLSQTMVTKHVDALEARLGVRLLHRTTRRLVLTEAGRAYLDACQRILAEIEEADHAAAAGQTEPNGMLRMNVPVPFGLLQVAPLLAAFSVRYPRVRLDVGFNDRIVDLVEEGWDLADLPGHDCLGYTLSDRMGADRWSFGVDGSAVAAVSGTLRTNNGNALRVAALAGMGLAYLPTFLVADDVRAGRLVAVVLDHPAMDAGHVHAVFRPDRQLPAKSRAMIDYLAARFGDDPPWDR